VHGLQAGSKALALFELLLVAGCTVALGAGERMQQLQHGLRGIGIQRAGLVHLLLLSQGGAHAEQIRAQVAGVGRPGLGRAAERLDAGVDGAAGAALEGDGQACSRQIAQSKGGGGLHAGRLRVCVGVAGGGEGGEEAVGAVCDE
jgi:hypothetical protein